MEQFILIILAIICVILCGLGWFMWNKINRLEEKTASIEHNVIGLQRVLQTDVTGGGSHGISDLDKVQDVMRSIGTKVLRDEINNLDAESDDDDDENDAESDDGEDGEDAESDDGEDGDDDEDEADDEDAESDDDGDDGEDDDDEKKSTHSLPQEEPDDMLNNITIDFSNPKKKTPNDSASLYDVGYIKESENDGNKYKVTADKNGRRRWTKA